MGNDASFEFSISTSIQPLKLQYVSQPINESEQIAYVFVNTDFQGLKWPDAEKNGRTAVNIFKNFLQFKKVIQVKNAEKEKIQEILSQIASDARKHEETKSETRKFVVGLAWIGHSLVPGRISFHSDIAEYLGIECLPRGLDGSEYL